MVWIRGYCRYVRTHEVSGHTRVMEFVTPWGLPAYFLLRPGRSTYESMRRGDPCFVVSDRCHSGIPVLRAARKVPRVRFSVRRQSGIRATVRGTATWFDTSSYIVRTEDGATFLCRAIIGKKDGASVAVDGYHFWLHGLPVVWSRNITPVGNLADWVAPPLPPVFAA